jgi:hypothetical protein
MEKKGKEHKEKTFLKNGDLQHYMNEMILQKDKIINNFFEENKDLKERFKEKEKYFKEKMKQKEKEYEEKLKENEMGFEVRLKEKELENENKLEKLKEFCFQKMRAIKKEASKENQKELKEEASLKHENEIIENIVALDNLNLLENSYKIAIKTENKKKEPLRKQSNSPPLRTQHQIDHSPSLKMEITKIEKSSKMKREKREIKTCES